MLVPLLFVSPFVCSSWPHHGVPVLSTSSNEESSQWIPILSKVDLVAFSSRQMAAVRALESQRSDALFYDNISALLAGPEAMAMADELVASVGVQGIGRKIAVRTRYFDDFVLDCSGRGIAQFVLLGAGMDTRAWRLKGLSGCRVFEVDSELVLECKADALGKIEQMPYAEVIGVAADISHSSWLSAITEAGVDLTKPIAWVAEGLLMYLSETQVEQLLSTIGRASCHSSALGASLVDRASLYDALASTSKLMNTWKWGCDDPKPFFCSHLGLEGSMQKEE
ncbi:unnamed protein product, partial [Chrysoparadoxa australica]